MRRPRLLITGLLLSFIVGCAGGGQTTVSYNSDKNITTYKTRSYTVSSISADNFASSKSVTVRAVAKCRGPDCTPETTQLVFSASGNQELSLSGIGGELVADDSQVVSWNSAEAGIQTQETGSGFGNETNISVIGKFAAVDLQLPQLRQLATASSVEGAIGGISLDFGTGVQSGFQSMLQKVIEAEKDSSGASQ